MLKHKKLLLLLFFPHIRCARYVPGTATVLEGAMLCRRLLKNGGITRSGVRIAADEIFQIYRNRRTASWG